MLVRKTFLNLYILMSTWQLRHINEQMTMLPLQVTHRKIEGTVHIHYENSCGKTVLVLKNITPKSKQPMWIFIILISIPQWWFWRLHPHARPIFCMPIRSLDSRGSSLDTTQKKLTGGDSHVFQEMDAENPFQNSYKGDSWMTGIVCVCCTPISDGSCPIAPANWARDSSGHSYFI